MTCPNPAPLPPVFAWSGIPPAVESAFGDLLRRFERDRGHVARLPSMCQNHGGGRQRFTDPDAERWIRAGLTATQIARLYGVHHQTIQTLASRLGLPLTTGQNGRPAVCDPVAVRALAEAGFDRATTARVLKVSSHALDTTARKNAISFKRKDNS